MNIRSYKESDYEAISELYKNSDLYGGEFDENRDSKDKLSTKIKNDPEGILVCESNNKIVGTVSLVEDGRVAWLFRFAVLPNDGSEDIIKLLFEKASATLKARGHHEVLVYSPVGNSTLDSRYLSVLNFERGADYTCFWKNI